MTAKLASHQNDNLLLAEKLLSGLSNPVIALDGQDRIVYVNIAGEEFFGSSWGILHNTPLSSLIDSGHAVFELVKRSRLTRASVSDQDMTITSPRLGQRLVHIQVSSLFDARADGNSDDGGLVVITLQESVARLRGHEQSRGAVRSMTSLSAMLAHEVKNPLAGIRGAAELLQSSGTANPADQHLTNLIVVEADRIAGLLTRMEGLAGQNGITTTAVNIHEVITHCISIAQNSFGKTRQIISRFDPSLPDAEGDRDMLIQVFINLIKNACEATEHNGHIEISTSYDLSGRLAVNKGDSQGVAPLIVEVADSGMGIAPDLHEHIFEPFITDKPNGTGLGLAMVAGAIADLGGTIEAKSESGRTSFKIGLRLASQNKGAEQ